MPREGLELFELARRSSWGAHVLAHHDQEPVVGFTGREMAVGGGQAERHLGGLERRVGILTADGEAGIAHTGKTAEAGSGVPRHDAHAHKLSATAGRCDGRMGLVRDR